MDIEFRTNVTIFSKARATTSRCNKVSIAVSSSTTDTEPDHFAWFGEIVEKYVTFFFIDKRSNGEFHDFISCIGTMHQLDSATFTILCCYFFDVAKI